MIRFENRSYANASLKYFSLKDIRHVSEPRLEEKLVEFNIVWDKYVEIFINMIDLFELCRFRFEHHFKDFLILDQVVDFLAFEDLLDCNSTVGQELLNSLRLHNKTDCVAVSDEVFDAALV